MPCDNITTRPPCQRFASERLQSQLLAQFLYAQAQESVSGFDATFAELATPTEGVCVPPPVSRQIIANNIAQGLEVDVNELNCFTDGQVWFIISNLICQLIDQLEP